VVLGAEAGRRRGDGRYPAVRRARAARTAIQTRTGAGDLRNGNVSFGDPPIPITVKWVTITPDRADIPLLRRSAVRPPHKTATLTPSEADMRHTTISGHHGTHHAVAAALWILAPLWVLAGIVAVIGVGGGLTRLAVALPIVTTEWWILSKVDHRLERNAAGSDAEMALVTHLRPALTDQRDLKKTSAPARWLGSSAA
jgi:hypothetical protein